MLPFDVVAERALVPLVAPPLEVKHAQSLVPRPPPARAPSAVPLSWPRPTLPSLCGFITNLRRLTRRRVPPFLWMLMSVLVPCALPADPAGCSRGYTNGGAVLTLPVSTAVRRRRRTPPATTATAAASVAASSPSAAPSSASASARRPGVWAEVAQRPPLLFVLLFPVGRCWHRMRGRNPGTQQRTFLCLRSGGGLGATCVSSGRCGSIP